MVQTRLNNHAAEEAKAAHETAATLVAGFAKPQNPEAKTDNHGDNLLLDHTYATVFSSIGLGVDPAMMIGPSDATEASKKAIRDAMERAVLRFPTRDCQMQLHVKLGVPPKFSKPNEPMFVELTALQPLLPEYFPLLPVEVVIGGLCVPQTESARAICTAVACVTVRQPQTEPTHHSISSPKSVTVEYSPLAPPAEWTEPQPKQIVVHTNVQAAHRANTRELHRATSMEMLARISAEIHEKEPNQEIPVPSKINAPVEEKSGNPYDYKYKKLPPGITPKNNKRLFVRHTYKDYCRETPSSEEMDLVDTENTVRTPNAAFPLKLHETLSQIETDGYDDIIGWLPHGRSFRIHKHDKFVELILPKYFVMTKKSSFLRQLNLYGFNRLSGVGPDQGSYYHEKFLRGMKFLSRRMQRLKVNGNGIRAAGNPDEEPDLSKFPPCPPNPNLQEFVSPQKLSLFQGVGSSQSSVSTGDLSDAVLRSSAGMQVSFPLKLQRILDKLEAEGNTNIVSWLSHGRAFLVHDSDRFVDELMPIYFNQTKYSSFQRQLHMYNFQRITAGRDKGAYHHPNFQRGRPQLSLKMHRTRVNGKGTRKPGNPQGEPNLYVLESLPPIEPGTKIEIPVEVPVQSDSGEEYSSPQYV